MSDRPKILLLKNGRFLTLDPSHPRAAALAILGDQIIAIDQAALTLEDCGQTIEILDLAGKTILPGMVDAHLHLEQYGLSLEKISCDTSTLSACVERVRRRAQTASPGEWLLGHGWDQNRWAAYGTRRQLDEAAPHNPVFLTAKSLHAGWANSAALRAAGIDPQSTSPDSPLFQRGPDGSLTGILFEDAQKSVSDVVPDPPLTRLMKLILEAQEKLLGFGITAVHDFDGRRCLEALQMLREDGALRLRVVKHIRLEQLDAFAQAGVRMGFGDEWLRIGTVKVFADGALGSRTAAMFAPYAGEPQNRGVLLKDREALFEIAQRAAAHGFGMSVHAIGDRAVHEVLQAFKAQRADERANNRRQMPYRIEHLQLCHPQDASLPSMVGAIVSMQPSHATADMEMADRYWGERAQNAYAWHTQLQHGATLLFGSDAPVESPNPFLGLHAATTRRRADGAPGPEGWFPAERITLQEAIEAYTVAPSRATGLGHRLGKLREGCLADLIVLNENPLDCPPEDLLEMRPSAVMTGGVWRIRSF